MNFFESTAGIFALFTLRIAFPIALTVLFGMLMNRITEQEKNW